MLNADIAAWLIWPHAMLEEQDGNTLKITYTPKTQTHWAQLKTVNGLSCINCFPSIENIPLYQS
jgi:hypothetical protein